MLIDDLPFATLFFEANGHPRPYIGFGTIGSRSHHVEKSMREGQIAIAPNGELIEGNPDQPLPGFKPSLQPAGVGRFATPIGKRRSKSKLTISLP